MVHLSPARKLYEICCDYLRWIILYSAAGTTEHRAKRRKKQRKTAVNFWEKRKNEKTKKRKNEKTENKLCPSYLLPFRDQSRLIHNMNFGVLAKTVRILVQKSRVHQNFAIQMLTRLLVCLFVVCCLSTFSCKHSSLQSTLTAVTATGCQVRVFCVRL